MARYLDWILQTRNHDPIQAAACYRRCLAFSETLGQTTGYYVSAHAALAHLAAQQQAGAACRYYAVVVDKAGRHEGQYAEARAYLFRNAGPKRP